MLDSWVDTQCLVPKPFPYAAADIQCWVNTGPCSSQWEAEDQQNCFAKTVTRNANSNPSITVLKSLSALHSVELKMSVESQQSLQDDMHCKPILANVMQ